MYRYPERVQEILEAKNTCIFYIYIYSHFFIKKYIHMIERSMLTYFVNKWYVDPKLEKKQDIDDQEAIKTKSAIEGWKEVIKNFLGMKA